MKPLVIYHADCADGFGAAFAAWLKLGDEAEYLPMAYNQNIDNVMFCDRDVYILDFSFDKKTMDGIIFAADHVVWLDHHKTSFEMWGVEEFMKGNLWYHDATVKSEIVLHNRKSGALLAWEYFHPNTEVPMLICHIDDYDRWQFKLEGSKELHAALESYMPWSFAQWRDGFLDEAGNVLSQMNIDALRDQGEHILRAQGAHVASIVKQAEQCEIQIRPGSSPGSACDYFFGLAVNSPVYKDDIGEALAKASGTYGLIWYSVDGVKAKCSLRSSGNYDVSRIAKAFGGGGHLNAAGGFEVDMKTLQDWLS